MTTRRELIGWGSLAVASAFVSKIALAQSGSVKLLLVRQTGYQNACVPCIPGKIYGVPATVDLAAAEQVIGLLTPIADSIELSYEEGGSVPSSIPEGTYAAGIRTDGTKRWMWSGGAIGTGTVDVDRAWRLELRGVPRRSNIQFHFGKDASWSAGCIIVGHRMAQCPSKGPCRFPDSPVSAVRALRNYVQATAISSATPIQIRVVSR